MSSILKTKAQKLLKAKWDAKLKASGFVDIEDGYGDEPLLKSYAGSDFNRERTRHTFHAKQAYFIAAEHFLNSHNFESKRDKRIWSLHVDGLSNREIAIKLKSFRYKLAKSRIHAIITELKREMLYGHHNN